jgi:hypothetical protein
MRGARRNLHGRGALHDTGNFSAARRRVVQRGLAWRRGCLLIGPQPIGPLPIGPLAVGAGAVGGGDWGGVGVGGGLKAQLQSRLVP